jgi:hypothetical protein
LEWLPGLVISSLHLRMIPELIGQGADKVDWLSIGVLANVTIELALTDTKGMAGEISPVRFFHLSDH